MFALGTGTESRSRATLVCIIDSARRRNAITDSTSIDRLWQKTTPSYRRQCSFLKKRHVPSLRLTATRADRPPARHRADSSVRPHKRARHRFLTQTTTGRPRQLCFTVRRLSGTGGEICPVAISVQNCCSGRQSHGTAALSHRTFMYLMTCANSEDASPVGVVGAQAGPRSPQQFRGPYAGVRAALAPVRPRMAEAAASVPGTGAEVRYVATRTVAAGSKARFPVHELDWYGLLRQFCSRGSSVSPQSRFGVEVRGRRRV